MSYSNVSTSRTTPRQGFLSEGSPSSVSTAAARAATEADAEVVHFLEQDAVCRRELEGKVDEQERALLVQNEKAERDTLAHIEEHRRRGITRKRKKALHQLLGTASWSNMSLSCGSSELRTGFEAEGRGLDEEEGADDPCTQSPVEPQPRPAAAPTAKWPALLSTDARLDAPSSRWQTEPPGPPRGPAVTQTLRPQLKALLCEGIRRETELQNALLAHLTEPSSPTVRTADRRSCTGAQSKHTPSELSLMAPVHESLQGQQATTPAAEAFTCYGAREVSAVSAKAGSFLAAAVVGPPASGSVVVDVAGVGGAPAVVQRLWVSTVLRQQLLVVHAALVWSVVLAPLALEAALTPMAPSDDGLAGSEGYGALYWGSGLNSARLLLLALEAAAALLVLLLVVGSGGLAVLRRPRLLVALLLGGCLGVSVGDAAVYVGFLRQSFWWPLGGKLAMGAGGAAAVCGLVGFTAAEVGVTAAVTLQLQLGLLLAPLAVLLAVQGVPFATAYLVSEEYLLLRSVQLVLVGSVVIPLLLSCLTPPCLLREAVAQHELLAAMNDNTGLGGMLRHLSPRFLLRGLTAATLVAGVGLLVASAPVLLAQPHQSSIINPYATVAALCVAAIAAWPLCFIPMLARVVQSWLPVPLVVTLLAACWLLFLRYDAVAPTFLGAVSGVAVMTVAGSVVRSLVNLGTSPAAPLPATTSSLSYSSPGRAAQAQAPAVLTETTPLLGLDAEDLVLSPLSDAPVNSGADAAAAVPRWGRSPRTPNPFGVLAISAVCGCFGLGLSALASAVASALLRDAEEFPMSSSKTLVPGVSVEANRVMVRVVAGLGGLALLAQLIEAVAQRNQWSRLTPEPLA